MHSKRRDGRAAIEPLERRALFAAAGVVIDHVFGYDRAEDVTLAPDGKIVVMGAAGDSAYVARYNADGSPDTSFGNGGTTVTTFNRSDVSSVAVGPDGSVVLGCRVFGATRRAAVARYTPSGSVDTSFGDSGLAMANDADGVSDSIESAVDVAVLPDGRVVAVGNVTKTDPGYSYTDIPPNINIDYTPTVSRVAVFRFRADGRPDNSFGGDGAVLTRFGDDSTQAKALAVQPDGKLVIAGSTSRKGHYDDARFALARYDRDGSLDASFGDGGLLRAELGGDVRGGADGIALLDGGRVVVAGQAHVRSSQFLIGPPFPAPDLALARFTPGGRLDTAFGGGDGISLDDVPPGDAVGVSDVGGVAAGPDGSVYVAGMARIAVRQVLPDPSGGQIERIVSGIEPLLARYTPSGERDAAFGTDGRVAFGFTPESALDVDLFTSVAVQADGKAVAVGGSNADSALARFDPDFSLDESFGGYVDTTAAPQPAPAATEPALRRGARLRRNGTLEIGGSAGDDAITVSTHGRFVRVEFGGRGRRRFGGRRVQRIVVTGGDGNDSIDLHGIAFPANVFGGAGDDTLYGGSGNDTLDGGPGNDHVGFNGPGPTVSEPGDDTVIGGDGEDWLVGGQGTDQVFGGSGSDHFFPGDTDLEKRDRTDDEPNDVPAFV
jgi:uncharacterized delta-60 repeat protein